MCAVVRWFVRWFVGSSVRPFVRSFKPEHIQAVYHLAAMAERLRENSTARQTAAVAAAAVSTRLTFTHTEDQIFQGSVDAAFSLQQTAAVF